MPNAQHTSLLSVSTIFILRRSGKYVLSQFLLSYEGVSVPEFLPPKALTGLIDKNG